MVAGRCMGIGEGVHYFAKGFNGFDSSPEELRGEMHGVGHPCGGSVRSPQSRERARYCERSRNLSGTTTEVAIPCAALETCFPGGKRACLQASPPAPHSLAGRSTAFSLAMNAATPPPGNKFVFEKRRRPERSPEPISIVKASVGSSLRALITAASFAPNDWHTLPGYQLSLRIMPGDPASPATTFEIRKSRDGDKSHRFRYDPRSNLLQSWNYDQIVHNELVLHRELPDDAFELGRMVATLIRQEPELAHALIQSNSVSLDAPSQDVPVARRGHGPLSHAFAVVLRHLTGHWFGGRGVDWGFWKRFPIALLGSLTFFIMLALRLSANPPDWLRSGRGLTPEQAGDAELTESGTARVLLLLAVSAFFAVINSWVDQQHGPARLYVGAFLLPFFVWALLVSIGIGGDSK